MKIKKRICYFLLVEILLFSSDGFIEILIHELKNQRQSSSRFIIKNFYELDDVGMRGDFPKCLNFLESLDLLDGIKMVFHTFDGNKIAMFQRLCF